MNTSNGKLHNQYSFTFNSQYCTAATSANLPNLKSYTINWSSYMPQGKYIMTSIMITNTTDLTGGFTKIPNVFVNFLANPNQYLSQVQNVYKSEYIGTLYPVLVDVNTHKAILKSDTMHNQPIYFNTRPTNNEITVSIYDNNNPAALWLDSASPTPVAFPNYILTLCFTLVDENKNLGC